MVVAKGTSEMHFAVTLGWKRPAPETATKKWLSNRRCGC